MQRVFYLWLIAGMTFFFSGCLSREVQVPILLSTVPDASLEQYVAVINHSQAIRSLTARINIQFQSDRDVEQGLSRRYRSAEGRIVLARAEKIRLLVQAPIVKTNITELASDGEEFQVIVYPKEYRTFLRGTNLRLYHETPDDLKTHQLREDAGAFARVRPQHFTEAFLFPPIEASDPNVVIFKEELLLIENDNRPNAVRDSRIIRTYSVLSIVERTAGKARLRRKYWFDRTRDLLLARAQVYGPEGELRAEIMFGDFVRPNQYDGFVPTKVEIRRPHDDYTVTVSVLPDTLDLNLDVPDQAFKLEMPADWPDVKVIDLDKEKKSP